MGRVRACAWALAVFVIGALPASAAAGVAPNRIGQIDCNGFSPIQQQLRITAACADIRGPNGQRFYDHGWYIGHDEPSIRYISNVPGSAADVTYVERLGREPTQLPTVRDPGSDVTHFFELTVAPWFSMNLCDPNSAPLTPCKPVSDSNAPHGSYPGGGNAFMELQFYPPGFAPFSDNISCDDTHWCSALTIDSLECNADQSICNGNCEEPVNFAFIQHNGVPTGPPSPQESDLATMTPNRQTLLMDPGDTIVVHMFDARLKGGGRALEVTEDDLTTHTSGFMIASAANGFMNTDPATCDGSPFNFQPEYSSAAPNNIVPWGPGAYNINTEYEVGHFEPCTNITGRRQTSTGDTFWTNCDGPYEASGEDQNVNPDLEPDDAPCYPFGDTHGGTAAPNLVTGCDVFLDAIGDLDYDGTSYWADWPTSAYPGRFPGATAQAQPTSDGSPYSRIQFVTDMSATEENCNTTTGAGCVMPPPGPGNFYPYWTLVRDPELGCTWQFGNAGRTGESFGGDAQWGTVNPNSIGAFQSAIQENPTRCGAPGS